MIDPATMAGLGQLAGGVGSVLGGLGFGSSSGDGIDVSENYRLGLAMGDLIPRNIRKQVKGTMVAAKDYGVHPMYLLGGGVSGASPSFQVGTSKSGGTDAAQVGAGLQKMSTAFSKESPVQQAMETLGLRQAEAETRNSEYQADLNFIALQKAKQAANATQESAVTYAAKPPHQQKAIPMYIKVRDRQGNEHWWPNPELGLEMPETFGLGVGMKGWSTDPTKSHINTGPRPASGRPRHYTDR